MSVETITPDTTMEELCQELPGARRALFRLFHIGGCASCGFQPTETIREVCVRNENLNPEEVITKVLDAQAQDEAMQITPTAAARQVELDPEKTRLLDIRTREEFDAVHIPNSTFFTQEMLQTAMGEWSRNEGMLIIIDHQGDRSLDAAAYFAGHGFENVRALQGGIDAWSAVVDPSLPRYHLEPA